MHVQPPERLGGTDITHTNRLEGNTIIRVRRSELAPMRAGSKMHNCICKKLRRSHTTHCINTHLAIMTQPEALINNLASINKHSNTCNMLSNEKTEVQFHLSTMIQQKGPINNPASITNNNKNKDATPLVCNDQTQGLVNSTCNKHYKPQTAIKTGEHNPGLH